MTDPTTHHLTSATMLRARTDLLASDLSETESVMLDIESGSYFGLESVAKTIWEALAQPRTFGDICELVSATYNTSGVDLEADISSFVAQLIDAGLVSLADH